MSTALCFTCPLSLVGAFLKRIPRGWPRTQRAERPYQEYHIKHNFESGFMLREDGTRLDLSFSRAARAHVYCNENARKIFFGKPGFCWPRGRNEEDLSPLFAGVGTEGCCGCRQGSLRQLLSGFWWTGDFVSKGLITPKLLLDGVRAHAHASLLVHAVYFYGFDPPTVYFAGGRGGHSRARRIHWC